MTATAAVAASGIGTASKTGAAPLRLQIIWCLPRQAASVSMVRHLLDAALAVIGVADDCCADIALALTEACANAVRYAHGSDEYRVTVIADPDQCVIEVIDGGVGLDHEHLDRAGIDRDLRQVTNAHGRGLPIIRAVTDGVELRPAQPHGLAIRMIKNLIWATDAPA